jgi:hypothetical protein
LGHLRTAHAFRDTGTVVKHTGVSAPRTGVDAVAVDTVVVAAVINAHCARIS